MNSVSYRSTIMACYTANFIGALVINLTPILFVPLMLIYNLSYTQFGLLIFVNFATQILTDIIFSSPTDKYGYRPFVVLAPILTIVGYLVFMLAPVLFNNPYHGFLLGTIIFSATGGLLELLLSAIINGIPGDQKARMMSVLHSFYAWGVVTVVLITTLGLYLVGVENWQWIIAAWSIFPVINVIQFATCKLPPQVAEEERQGAKFLLNQRIFYIIVAIIAFSGMSEVTMALWTSAFLERAMNLPKVFGDLVGVCLFAVMLGSGRLLYGIFGEKHDVWKFMFYGSILAVFLYIIAALSGLAVLSVISCVVCGFAVSLLWPGSVVLAGRQFPLAGSWLYAMLAAGGDIGAAVGPYMLGVLADNSAKISWLSSIFANSGLSAEQFGLRFGLLVGAIFPVVTVILLLIFKKERQKQL